MQKIQHSFLQPYLTWDKLHDIVLVDLMREHFDQTASIYRLFLKQVPEQTMKGMQPSMQKALNYSNEKIDKC